MAQLRQMVSTLRHLPTYQTGTWTDESLGVYVGWVERRDAFSNEMPLQNERMDRILVFSGEEYPDPQTANRLRESDTNSTATVRPTWFISQKKRRHFLRG